jgi:hypothetical protein
MKASRKAVFASLRNFASLREIKNKNERKQEEDLV